MAVSTETRVSGPYAGNGVTTVFAFSFYLPTTADLQVIETATGLETVVATGYTVSRNSDQSANPGGSITYAVAPAVGTDVTLTTDAAYTQTLDLQSGGPFSASVLNGALDRIVVLIQQAKDLASRGLHLAVSSASGVSTELPVPESQKLIGWNEAETGLQNFDAATLATLVAYGTATADQFTGDGVTTAYTLSSNPIVLANLDVSVGGVVQLPTTDYTISGTTLTFTTAPPNGAPILARYMQGLAQNAPDLDGAVGSLNSLLISYNRTAAEIAAGVTPTNYTYPAGDVRRYGAVVNGSTDDTTAWTAALASNSSIYACAGTHVIQTAVFGDNQQLATAGFATIVQQKSGVSVGTRLICVAGSRVTIGSLKVKGNIATDTNEQNHGVFVYKTGASIQDITIGDISGEDIRGDVLYLGAPSTFTTKYVTFGRIVGKNILRNVVSIVGASYVNGKAAIVDTSTGYAALDIEPDTVTSTNIYVGEVRGAVLQCAPPLAANTARKIRIGMADLDPAYAADSTPAYAPRNVANAVVLRNTIDFTIDSLTIANHTGIGVTYIYNVGEQRGQNIRIGYLKASGIGSGESTYNTVCQFQAVDSFTVASAEVSLQTVGDSVFLGDSSGATYTRGIVDRIACDGRVARYIKHGRFSNVVISTTNATSAFFNCYDCTVMDSDITIPTLINFSDRPTFINVKAVCSTDYYGSTVTYPVAVNTYFNSVSSQGSFTLGAAVTTTVNNANVFTTSKIVLVPTNAAAGTLMGSAKALYVSARTKGTSFVVSTASGVAAAGTETFDYEIV